MKPSRQSTRKFQSPLTRSNSLKGRLGSLKRKLIITGVILAVWFGVNAAWRFRSQDIANASLVESHQIVGENIWALRWKYGWETSSRQEQKEGATEPTTWRVWRVSGGGQLEVEFLPHEWSAQAFKARLTNPISHTPIVLDGRAFRK